MAYSNLLKVMGYSEIQSIVRPIYKNLKEDSLLRKVKTATLEELEGDAQT